MQTIAHISVCEYDGTQKFLITRDVSLWKEYLRFSSVSRWWTAHHPVQPVHVQLVQPVHVQLVQLVKLVQLVCSWCSRCSWCSWCSLCRNIRVAVLSVVGPQTPCVDWRAHHQQERKKSEKAKRFRDRKQKFRESHSVAKQKFRDHGTVISMCTHSCCDLYRLLLLKKYS